LERKQHSIPANAIINATATTAIAAPSIVGEIVLLVDLAEPLESELELELELEPDAEVLVDLGPEPDVAEDTGNAPAVAAAGPEAGMITDCGFATVVLAIWQLPSSVSLTRERSAVGIQRETAVAVVVDGEILRPASRNAIGDEDGIVASACTGFRRDNGPRVATSVLAIRCISLYQSSILSEGIMVIYVQRMVSIWVRPASYPL
jgi:hypothetical protein